MTTLHPLLQIADQLTDDLARLSFPPPVAFVYHPLVYARAAHGEYLAKYAAAPREVVFLGMNPGPWGMAQTGVPFGEVGAVRDWMGIDAPVRRPARGAAADRLFYGSEPGHRFRSRIP